VSVDWDDPVTGGTIRQVDRSSCFMRRPAVDGLQSGVATEFRLLGESWGFAADEVDRPVRLWHGRHDSNVPLASVQRFSQQVSEGELRTVDGDHLSTLVDCRADVLAHHE